MDRALRLALRCLRHSDHLTDERRLAARCALRRAEIERRRQFQVVEDYCRRACRQIRQAIAEILQAAGFYQHQGQWRTRRMTPEPAEPPATHPLAVRRAFLDAYKAADRPNPSAQDQAALRKILRDHPEALAVFLDLASCAAVHLANAMGTTWARSTLWLARHDRVRQELGYDRAGPLERLLIEQVALSALRMYHAEAQCNQSLRETEPTAAGRYWDRRLSAAQTRYLRAVETLTRVRRLMGLPAVQVNIAMDNAQQVVANAPSLSRP